MDTANSTTLTSASLAEYLAAGGRFSQANQGIVADLVRREVIYCVSTLVATIAGVAADQGRIGDTDYDEVLDIQRGMPDYESAAREEGWGIADAQVAAAVEARDEGKLRSLYDHFIGEPGDDEGYPLVGDLIDELQGAMCCEFIQLRPLKSGIWIAEESNADGWRELCEEQRIDPQEPEVFEHWIVSEWAAEKLKAMGERVGDIEGMTVWARCTTGQSMCLDEVWQEIAAGMQILEGQCNDWSKRA